MKRELKQCILLLCKFDYNRNIIIYGIENLSTNLHIGYIQRNLNNHRIKFSSDALDNLTEDLMKIYTDELFEIKAYINLNLYKYDTVFGYIKMVSARKARSTNHEYKHVIYTIGPDQIYGHTNFFCCNCGNIIKVNNEPFIKFKNSAGSSINTAGAFASFAGKVICPKCNKSNGTFHVDDLYKNIIKTLHDKGYFTQFHCQGHTNNSLFNTKGVYPYIVFEGYDILSIISKIDEAWVRRHFYTEYIGSNIKVYANPKDMILRNYTNSKDMTDNEYILLYKSLFTELAERLPENNKEE